MLLNQKLILYFATDVTLEYPFPQGYALTTEFKLSVRRSLDWNTPSMCDATGIVGDGVIKFNCNTFTAEFERVCKVQDFAYVEVYTDTETAHVVFYQKPIFIGSRVGTLDGQPPEPVNYYIAQIKEMPEASASNLGRLYLYTGEQTEDYTPNRFYKCVVDDGTYYWEDVTPGGTFNYNVLENKPKIGGVTLSGDKTIAELGGVQDVKKDGESKVVGGVAVLDDFISTGDNDIASDATINIICSEFGTQLLTVKKHGDGAGKQFNLNIGVNKSLQQFNVDSNTINLKTYKLMLNGCQTNIAGGFCISDASTGNLPVPGAVTEKVTPIPEDADNVTLALGYSEHEPDAAVVYTLPTPVDGRTNTVTLHIKFTNTTSYAFFGVTETLPTVALGDEWTFVANYELGAWHIYARKIGNQTVGNLVGLDLAGTMATVDANGVAHVPKASDSNYGLIRSGYGLYVANNGQTLCVGCNFMQYKSTSPLYFMCKETIDAILSPLEATPTVENLYVHPNACYTHTLEDGDIISFGTPRADTAPTFELWLTQPETPVAVEFAETTNIWWADANGNFAAANPAPETLTAGRTYYYQFQWDGVLWLGKLKGYKN